MINREGTKKIIKISIIFLFSIIILGYAFFTSYNFLAGPKISIYEPLQNSVINSQSVIIKGTATRIKDINMNGKPVIVDKDGNFEEILLLSPGYNSTLFSAKDRFNRTTEYKLELVYKK